MRVKDDDGSLAELGELDDAIGDAGTEERLGVGKERVALEEERVAGREDGVAV